MPGPWIDDSVVLAAVAAELGKLPQDLEPRWVDAARDGNAAAADDLVQAFVEKGYAAAQVDAWDQRTRYNKRLALYHALLFGGGGGLSPAELERLVEGLLTQVRERVSLLAGNKAVAPDPAASDIGGITSGTAAFLDPADDRGLFR